MDDHQRIKAAFLFSMADNGLTPSQAEGAASIYILMSHCRPPDDEKRSIDLTTLALLGLIGVPVAAGLTGGYMAARAGDDPMAVDRLKHRELMNELNSQTESIRKNNRFFSNVQQPTPVPFKRPI